MTNIIDFETDQYAKPLNQHVRKYAISEMNFGKKVVEQKVVEQHKKQSVRQKHCWLCEQPIRGNKSRKVDLLVHEPVMMHNVCADTLESGVRRFVKAVYDKADEAMKDSTHFEQRINENINYKGGDNES